jgi:glycosyltransferase involved in cell wall biosynthesis
MGIRLLRSYDHFKSAILDRFLMEYTSQRRRVNVTLGMCVKNAENTVEKAIQSVLNQDYPREFMELILVDGNSRDHTVQILKENLKGQKIRVDFFCEAGGLGLARQMVVNKAAGAYIIWVDSDMILSEDFVTKQVSFMDAHPKAGIAKGKYCLQSHPENEQLVATLEDVEFVLSTLHEGLTDSKSLGTSGCIYRVKAIRQVGGFDLNITGAGEDTDAENRIHAAGWELYITSALFCEVRRQSWRSLWNEYFWLGQGGQQVLKKNSKNIDLYKLIPAVALVYEFLRVPSAYKATYRRAVVFLPIHYVFKRSAWLLGFIRRRFAREEQRMLSQSSNIKSASIKH